MERSTVPLAADSVTGSSTTFWSDNRGREFLLLTPRSERVPSRFSAIQAQHHGWQTMIERVQRFRAAVYSADGAVRTQDLTSDGRHVQPADEESWHLVLCDQDGDVMGCARYRRLPPCFEFEDLSISRSALAADPEWGNVLRKAVESEAAEARRLAVDFVELGGWALAERVRHSCEALRMALSLYAISQFFGGAVGITTATNRHESAAILRRLGGVPLQLQATALPAYFDPQYGCDMQVLRFDSWACSRFAPSVAERCKRVADLPVLAPDYTHASFSSSLSHLGQAVGIRRMEMASMERSAVVGRFGLA